jgi:hypothetical protein
VSTLEYQFADVTDVHEEHTRKCDACDKPAVLWLHHSCLCAACYWIQWRRILRETRHVA